jgi:hypothetical protein
LPTAKEAAGILKLTKPGKQPSMKNALAIICQLPREPQETLNLTVRCAENVNGKFLMKKKKAKFIVGENVTMTSTSSYNHNIEPDVGGNFWHWIIVSQKYDRLSEAVIRVTEKWKEAKKRLLADEKLLITEFAKMNMAARL